MRIIISPAKKMNADTDSFPSRGLPRMLERTEALLAKLREMSYEELKALWKCNDQIAELNFRRLRDMDLRRGLAPAIMAYEGIQYQYMAPGVFTREALDYVSEHLRILSGFYGVLLPFDGVTPYRLEMQAKLPVGGAADLYGFWGGAIAGEIFSRTDCVVNLASKEYSVCVSRHLPPVARLVTCVFGEEKNGRIVEKGTLCKMARGELVRFMAERQAGSRRPCAPSTAWGTASRRSCPVWTHMSLSGNLPAINDEKQRHDRPFAAETGDVLYEKVREILTERPAIATIAIWTVRERPGRGSKFRCGAWGDCICITVPFISIWWAARPRPPSSSGRCPRLPALPTSSPGAPGPTRLRRPGRT